MIMLNDRLDRGVVNIITHTAETDGAIVFQRGNRENCEQFVRLVETGDKLGPKYYIMVCYHSLSVHFSLFSVFLLFIGESN